jgi:hypothetical protein
MLREASGRMEVDFKAPRPEPDQLSQGNLESALGEVEARLGAAANALTGAQRQLKQAIEAARHGRIAELSRALDGLVTGSDALTQTVLNAQRSWTFDVRAHLDGGGYLAELLEATARTELPGVREVDGQLCSFPVVVKVDSRNVSLKVGKASQRSLRPSVVVELLRRLRTRPARDNTRQLLVAFETAYLKETADAVGIAVPLRRIYDLLVLRPGQSREYTELDFMLDVYKLDRTEAQVTPAGREMSLPASTGTRAGKGIDFVTETGEVRTYSSIRFDSD